MRPLLRGLLRASMALTAALGACESEAQHEAIALTGGHPDRGKVLIEHYGCGACHTIPGIPGANANVGPSLARIAGRSYIAGVLPNTPDNLERWILNPPAVNPRTAMPVTGVQAGEITDVAAYLYTLR